MSTRALALVLILTTSAFAGCTGGDPDAGGTDELDIEMIMDFLNNSSIEVANYNYYNNSTTNTYFVNGTNSVPTLHSLNGVISPSESVTNIENYTELGFLVNLAQFEGATSPLDLDGANICVGIGSMTESAILNFYSQYGMTMTTINTENAAAAQENFLDGSCGVWTGDMSAMVARLWGLRDEGMDLAIMPELLSKEPLGAATRDNDDDWNDVVAWVWYGMITAEEFGIDGSNYGDFVASENPGINRLLNSNLGLGTDANPLSDTWMQAVLGAVGNYYDAYDRSFCDGDGAMANCLIDRAGTLNDLVANGGIQYAPPMR